MHTPTTLQAYLSEQKIPYHTHHHAPVFTVEESQQVTADLPGAHVKNLFLRDKKKTGLWLVTVEHNKRVDLKALKEPLGARGNLSFCNADTLWEHLGVTPGSVTPLAAINDRAGAVQVWLDEDILQATLVNVHPLQNDMTTALAPQDLLRFLEETGHSPQIAPIPQIDTSTTA